MSKLEISKALHLPLETVTQAMAILAKRRAGKSYTMRRLVEQLLKANQQVVLVDPKGDQWGIRSGADGKSAGYPVIILGGEHADVPLEVNGGEIVAKLAVEERVNILLDLSLFRKHEVATFMTGFMENLYRLKAREQYRTPVMLVIDEADAIAPQKPQKGEERMLGAAEDIVRRGGQRGIGCILVTQRAAVLNKNVLTQAQILVALRTIAPQDLDAMKAWIDVHGTDEQRKTLMGSLPSLPVGDAWFWSPGWPTADGIFQRTHVLPIETFDSGKTPEPGEKRIEPKRSADIDLNALKRQMAATMQKAKENDPTELKKKIRDLERERDKGPVVKAPATTVDVKLIEREVEKVKRAYQQNEQKLLKEFSAYRMKVTSAIQSSIKALQFIADFKAPPVIETPDLVVTIPSAVMKPKAPTLPVLSMQLSDDKKLGRCERMILSFLASNERRSWSAEQVAIMTKYSVGGGGFSNAVSALVTQGFIERNNGQIRLLALPEGFRPEKIEFSVDGIKEIVGRCEREIIRFLLENPDGEFSIDEIASNTFQANGEPYAAGGGGFGNSVSKLSSLGFLTRNAGRIKLSDDVKELL